MQMPEPLQAHAGSYRLHPALLDACFHVVGAALPGGGATLGDAFLLLQVERVRVFRPLGVRAWTHVTVHADERTQLATRETIRAELRLLDDDGGVIAAFEGLHFKRAPRAALSPSSSAVARARHAARAGLAPAGGARRGDAAATSRRRAGESGDCRPRRAE